MDNRENERRREDELQSSPYMRTYYQNPPPPVARPITTNLQPNPYHPSQGPLHLRATSRLGTYARRPEPPSDMGAPDKRNSSLLVAAALGPPQAAKSRARDGPLGAVRRAQDAGYNELISPLSKSRKRNYDGLDSSSDLSEDDDDDFSPATQRRLAPSPIKQRQRQTTAKTKTKQRQTQRYLSDDDYDEEMLDSDNEDLGEDLDEDLDQDARQEEALMRLIANHNARKISSTSKKTPASKRINRDAPTTPMAQTALPTPSDKTSLMKKPKGKPVPQDLKSADVADRMMFRWKNAGRPWDEIRDEYFRLTGTRPASSSLSVRFIKLNENLVANGFKDAIQESFYETFPDRKYLKTYTKSKVQEVALLKAHAEAKVEQSQPFWKEVSIQMKKITGEYFAPASLRKRMEQVKKRQFYLGEQSPTKDNQWPSLPTASDGKTSLFQKMPNLDSRNEESSTKIQIGRPHTSNNSLFTAEQMPGGIDDSESISTAVGQARSSHFIYSKDKDQDMSGATHYAFEEEIASPTHTHPRGIYGNVEDISDFASDSPEHMSVVISTPTPATTAGAAFMGRAIGSGPRAGLVGYGDSDDSD